MIELKVPTLGESVSEATVGTWFKKAGDNVAVDEMICELETDKVTIEVPSTIDGIVSKIIVKEGETVELDAILAIFCLLYTSPSPRDGQISRMPSSA